MKHNTFTAQLRFLSSALFAVLFLFSSVGAVMPLNAARPFESEPYYTFVVIETSVSRDGEEISSRNPQERRFYVSNVIAFPGDPQLKAKADEIADYYFTKTISEPLKAKGILLEWYERDVQIDGGAVYTPASRAEAEELRLKTLEELKEQNANVFTFTWQLVKEPKGMDMAKPALFERDPEQPLHEPKAEKTPSVKPNR